MAFTPIKDINQPTESGFTPTTSAFTPINLTPEQSAATLGTTNHLMLGGFLKGIAKSVVETLDSANAIDASARLGGGMTLQDVTGVDMGKVVQPENTSEEVGKIVGTGAQMLPGAGKVMMSAGQRLAKIGLPITEAEAGKLQAFRAKVPFRERLFGTSKEQQPTTAAQTIFNKGLMGTESMIGVQARKRGGKIWKEIVEPALKTSKEKVNMPSFFKEAETKVIKNAKELGDRASRIEALEAIAEDYKKNPIATMEDLQGYKEGWASHVPEKYYKGKDITQTYNNVRAELAALAREKIYTGLGKEAKQAYLDYGNLKAVQKLGQSAIAGSGFKGGSGKLLTHLKEMALVPVGTVSGQAVYKIGQGLEIIGRPGARLLGDLLPDYMILQAIQAPQKTLKSLEDWTSS